MKKILGLDLGTNSIGWAVVEIDHDNKIVRIIALGSRIIPMGSAEISKYESGGKLKSSAADRTTDKGIRKNISRALLRRDRLHCVLNLLNMLPEHYKIDIEFVDEKGKRSGKIIKGREPKIAYYTDDLGKKQFLFKQAYTEMEAEFKAIHPELFYRKGNKTTRIPYDWTLYYLRKKALYAPLTSEELAWVIMSFLQKRGYEKVMGINEKEEKENKKEEKEGELHEEFNAKVSAVELLSKDSIKGISTYHIQLVDEYENNIFDYNEEATYQITMPNEYKKVEKITKLDCEGNVDKVNIYIQEIKNLEIVSVTDKHEFKSNKRTYEVMLKAGWKYELTSRYIPKIAGTERDFVITTEFDQKGRFQSRSFKMPDKDSKQLAKLKTETSLQAFNSDYRTKGVASFIYNSLLHNPNQKIKAGLVETIERDYYKEEFRAIFECQKQYHPELRDKQNYMNALKLLYPNNEIHRNTLSDKDFSHLLGDDIIFYQRDLKSKKSLIADCKYEYVKYRKDDVEIKKHLKCIPVSNPLFQEFRLWKFIKNLRIFQKDTENDQGEKLVNLDVTDDKLTLSAKERLFEQLNNRKEISQSALLRLLGLDTSQYTWNYEESHIEPCNETRYDFVRRLKRIKGFDWEIFLSAKSKIHAAKHESEDDKLIDGPTNEYLLWHFFYSVKKKGERITGLPKLVEKLLDNAAIDASYNNKVVEMLCTISTYKNGYGRYSEKAIKKLLPFMRLGNYWTLQDVESIMSVSMIKPETLEKLNLSGEISELQGLQESSACYIVYGRYSEASDASHWSQPIDIKNYLLNEFKHNSINNPIVEKIVRETLMVVHDIWTTYGCQDGFLDEEETIPAYKKFFDQINVEIGTSLKKNAKQREAESAHNADNRKANQRAYEMLKELKTVYKKAGIDENSTYQREKFRILEEGAINAISRDKDNSIYDYKIEASVKPLSKKEIMAIIDKEASKISRSDIVRYRLWLEQRYRCPYTGVYISLSELFDRTKYQIDHVFPQERITLNSMSNKVICKAIANQAKGAMTGYEFILKSQGKTHYKGQEVLLLSPKDYVQNVEDNIKDPKKKEIMLSKVIPAKFGNNQLSNSQYIAKVAMGLLSNIVREEGENEFKSKNVLVISGAVTAKLKRDWQLDEAWNELILPRFLNVNSLVEDNKANYIEKKTINGHDILLPVIPDNSVDKKRIDHRHHALDALIVALATSNHVNYINNISGLDINSDRISERKDLKAKYMITKKRTDGAKYQFFLPPMQFKIGEDIVAYRYAFKNLFENAIFKKVVLVALQNTLVTFKQNNRLMRQRMNYIQHPEHSNNLQQTDLNKKKNYSIRQSLHKQTYYGLREIRPLAIEEAIKKPNIIVEGKVKHLIQQLKELGKQKDEIVKQLKPHYPVVYVHEECITTQWARQLEYLADIKDKEEDKKLQKTGKTPIIREIECVADIVIQNILKKHLAKYDSIKVPVAEAVTYYNDIIDEGQKAIVDEYLAKGSTKETHVDIFVKGRETQGLTIYHNPQIAFTTDGITDMNNHIEELNNNKRHKPIFKVKVTQAKGKAFLVSEPDKDKPLVVKNKQYVITDSDSNRFCGIYKDQNGNTKIYVPSLRETIATIKLGEAIMPQYHPDKETFGLKFCLSPLDMVYMPTKDEIEKGHINNNVDISRIYVVNDFKGNTVYFRPYYYAAAIIKNEIDLRLDEKGNTIGSCPDKTANCEGMSIRDNCVPIKTDRLGNILKIGYE